MTYLSWAPRTALEPYRGVSGVFSTQANEPWSRKRKRKRFPRCSADGSPKPRREPSETRPREQSERRVAGGPESPGWRDASCCVRSQRGRALGRAGRRSRVRGSRGGWSWGPARCSGDSAGLRERNRQLETPPEERGLCPYCRGSDSPFFPDLVMLNKLLNTDPQNC